MRAAVFEAFETVRVRDVPAPEVGPGDALVSVRLCGICGSDVSLFKTGILAGSHRVLGHEIVGGVEGGTGEGTRVVPLPIRACGECAWCRREHPRYCLRAPDRGGGFAELVAYPAEYLVPVPEGLDDRAAALAEPLGVAIRAVRIAETSPGDLVYVSGLGSIGLLATVAAIDAGARVIGGDPREDRRGLARDLGCEDTFDPTVEDPFWKLFAYDELGARVALECSGATTAVQLALNVARHGGVVGLLGIPFEPAPILPAVVAVKELRAFSISGPERADVVAALGVLERRAGVASVATSVVPLEETGAAMRRLAYGEGSDVKVLVDPRR